MKIQNILKTFLAWLNIAEKEQRILVALDNKIKEVKMVKMCLFMEACACR